MQKSKEVLCIFSRYPVAGKTKTRLIPVLGKSKAAELQQKLSAHLFAQCQGLLNLRQIDIQVHATDGSLEHIREWVPENMECYEQVDGDIGRRMQHALQENFAQNATSVVIVGSDCPGVTAEIIDTAFASLTENDLVLGPSCDGGFYLIGMKSNNCMLLEEIDWQTDKTLVQVISRAQHGRLTYTALKTLEDIDRPADLKYLKQYGVQFFFGT